MDEGLLHGAASVGLEVTVLWGREVMVGRNVKDNVETEGSIFDVYPKILTFIPEGLKSEQQFV